MQVHSVFTFSLLFLFLFLCHYSSSSPSLSQSFLVPLVRKWTIFSLYDLTPPSPFPIAPLFNFAIKMDMFVPASFNCPHKFLYNQESNDTSQDPQPNHHVLRMVVTAMVVVMVMVMMVMVVMVMVVMMVVMVMMAIMVTVSVVM